MCILPQSSKKEAAFFLKDDLHPTAILTEFPSQGDWLSFVAVHGTLKIVILGT